VTETTDKIKELRDAVNSIPWGPVVVDVALLADILATSDGLREALEAARDHLEFCGYGDAYERECAEAQGLSNQIDRALEPPK